MGMMGATELSEPLADLIPVLQLKEGLSNHPLWCLPGPAFRVYPRLGLSGVAVST